MYVMLSIITIATSLLSTNISETNVRLNNMQECKAFLELRKTSVGRDDKIEEKDGSLIMERKLNFVTTWNSIYICKEIKDDTKN